MTSTYINHAWGGQQDRPIIQYAYPLILFGLLAIASSGRSVHVEPFYFFYKQLLFCLSGIVIYLIGQKIGSHRWCFEFKHLWPLMVLLLILPLSPLGSEINGAKRWLQLFGFGFQPTEFVKVMWVFFISKFAYDYHLVLQKDMFSTSFMWLKLLVILSLMLMQPDFGSMAVLLFLTLAILFVAKVRIDFFFALVIICLIICVGLILVAPYRAARVIAFLDPWAHSQGQGYQLIASLIALGSGGFFGKGLGLSSQKYRALPEAHTDFVFSIIGEEMGLVGAGVLFLSYGYFIALFFKKALIKVSLKDYLAGYAFIASGVLFFMEVAINIGVCTGLLPTKGIALPFLSYGGSSLWASLFLLGVLDGLFLMSKQTPSQKFQ